MVANYTILQPVDLYYGTGTKNNTPTTLMLPGDNKGHVWTIPMLSQGMPADITETVTANGYFQRADGNVVLCPGTVTGNVVTVTLLQACYAIEGNMLGVVRVTNATTGMITTLCEANFRVSKALNGEIIDPGEVIPDIDNLLAQIAAMEAATAAANTAASNANKAMETLPNILIGSAASPNWVRGGIRASDGANMSSTTRLRSGYILPNICMKIDLPDGMRAYTYRYTEAAYTSFIADSGIGWQTGSIIMPGDGTYYRIVLGYTSDAEITVSAASDVTVTVYDFTDTTLTMSGKAADAAATASAISAVETALQTSIDGKMGRAGTLTNADDLNSGTYYGVYRWSQSRRPANAPNNQAGVLFAVGIAGNYAQYVITANGVGFVRYQSTGGYTAWDTITSVAAQLTSSADLDTISTIGTYWWNSNDAPTNSPTNFRAILSVSGSGNVYSQSVYNAQGVEWTRFHDRTTFTDWVKHEYYHQSTLTSADDLDTTTAVGSYAWASGAVPAHCPTTAGGTVVVSGSETRISQYVIDDNGTCYARGYNGSEFSDWEALASNTGFDDYMEKLGMLDFSVVNGTRISNGNITTNSNKTVTTSTVMRLGKGTKITVLINGPWRYNVLTGDAANDIHLRPIYSQSRLNTIILDADFIGINFYKYDPETGTNIYPIYASDFDRDVILFVDDNSRKVSLDVPENIGVLNAIYRTYQLTKAQYTTRAILPGQVADVPSGTALTGIMYSSVRMFDYYVPQGISIHTYMTALTSPNSYLYTRNSVSPNSKTYYGAVCSSLTDYAYGFDYAIYTSHEYPDIDGMERPENQSPYGLKLGDVLSGPGHIVIVTEIARDELGRIVWAEISEAWKPRCMSRRLPLNGTDSRSSVQWYFDNGYEIYRYKPVYAVTYEASPWVHVDPDEYGEPTYSTELMPRRGDKSNWRQGETVEIDVLNAGSNTYYRVYKDGTRTMQTAIPANNLISLTGLTPGQYMACLTDGTTEGVPVYFDVYSTTASYEVLENEQVRVTFSASSNATPSAICWCKPSSAGSSKWAVMQVNKLSDSEISGGAATVAFTDFNRDYYRGTGYTNFHDFLMNVMYKTRYGLVMSGLWPVDTQTLGAQTTQPEEVLRVPEVYTSNSGGGDDEGSGV